MPFALSFSLSPYIYICLSPSLVLSLSPSFHFLIFFLFFSESLFLSPTIFLSFLLSLCRTFSLSHRSVDHQTCNSGFESHRVPHSFGLLSHLSFSFSLSPSLSLSISLSHSLSSCSFSLSPRLSFSFCSSFFFFFYLWGSISLFLYLSLFLSLSLCISVCLSFSCFQCLSNTFYYLSLSLSLSRPFFLYLFFHTGLLRYQIKTAFSVFPISFLYSSSYSIFLSQSFRFLFLPLSLFPLSPCLSDSFSLSLSLSFSLSLTHYGAVEYTDCFNVEEYDPHATSALYISLNNPMVRVQFWGRRNIPLLPSLPGPLWPGVVAPDWVLYMGQIELNFVLIRVWIAWNRTVLTLKLCTYAKLIYLKKNCFCIHDWIVWNIIVFYIETVYIF